MTDDQAVSRRLRRHAAVYWPVYLVVLLLAAAVGGILAYGVGNGDPPDVTCHGTGRVSPAFCQTTTTEAPR